MLFILFIYYYLLIYLLSTFVQWQILENTGRCVAVSEPTSPFLVAMKYQKLGDSPEIRQLARDVIRWECRPYPQMQPLGYCLKLTSISILAGKMFRLSLLHFLSFYLSDNAVHYNSQDSWSEPDNLQILKNCFSKFCWIFHIPILCYLIHFTLRTI